MTHFKKTLLAAAALAFAGAALADGLAGLPQPVKLRQTGDSPGAVSFDHGSHVDAAKPACLSCHPREFGILGRSARTRRAPITHAGMEEGRSCGACHGEEAFGFEDCSMCHEQ